MRTGDAHRRKTRDEYTQVGTKMRCDRCVGKSRKTGGIGRAITRQYTTARWGRVVPGDQATTAPGDK